MRFDVIFLSLCFQIHNSGEYSYNIGSNKKLDWRQKSVLLNLHKENYCEI